MRLVVDTGVFSAALSRRRRSDFERHVQILSGQQLFLATVTVAELRYGAIVAEWGEARRRRLEQAIVRQRSGVDCRQRQRGQRVERRSG